MNSNFIPPKPPDISPSSPGAYVTVNEDVDNGISVMEFTDINNDNSNNSIIRRKKDKRKTNKIHRPECSKYLKNLKDSSIPLGQFLDSQNSIYRSSQINESSTPQPSLDNLNISKTLYSENDKGPYVVHVQKKQENILDSSVNKDVILNPIIFGKFIQKNTFRGIVPGSIVRIGRNRIKLSFNSFKDANNFVNNSIITENSYNAFIPTFCVTKLGIIKVHTDVSDNDIMCDVVIPNSPIKILKVRRLKYKVVVDDIPSWKPSQTVVITFEGQVLPEFVFLYYNKINVQMYRYPTVQCYSCCRFGHMKSNCRAKPRCFKCGQGHSGDTCGIVESESSCLICSGNHFATNKKCPEYSRQQNIKSLMSQKSISYMEANKIEPKISKSFADVAKTTSYKKTIFEKPKSIKKYVGKGYDVDFHRTLLNEFSLPNPKDGCALSKDTNDISSESTLKSILMLLIEIIKNQNLPDNVELLLNNIFASLNHGSSSKENNTVELSESSK